MTRKNKSSVDIKSVSEFLNDLACIISSYQLLDGKNTSFINTSFRLDPGIENVFSIFKQDVQKKIINKNIDDVRKYFKDSVRLAGWDLK